MVKNPNFIGIERVNLSLTDEIESKVTNYIKSKYLPGTFEDNCQYISFFFVVTGLNTYKSAIEFIPAVNNRKTYHINSFILIQYIKTLV